MRINGLRRLQAFVKWALVALILLDAVLTYVAVGFLGVREIVLTFVNQIPPAVWLAAAVKVSAVFYVDKTAKRYTWARHILSAAAALHLIAFAINMCQLFTYLLYFP
jgi:hypothetical protein